MSATSRIFRLAHMSDVHVLGGVSITNTSWRQIMGKRITGLLNIYFKRGPKKHPPHVFEAALNDATQLSCDHIALTGDVTNLSLDREFKAARELITRWQVSAENAPRLSIIPGNHDIYTEDQAGAPGFMKELSDYTVSDVRFDGYDGGHAHGMWRPFVHVGTSGTGHDDHPVVVLGINSCHPRPVYVATGEILPAELQQAQKLLDEVKSSHSRGGLGLPYTVLMVHHPAIHRFDEAKEKQHALDGESRRALAEFAHKNDVSLILHGHNHIPFYDYMLDDASAASQASPEGLTHLKDRVVPLVFEAGSTTMQSDDPTRSARYNVYEIDPTKKMGGLVRVYSRVWDEDTESFREEEISVPSFL
eukprot:GFYU01007789.1.p1 GENE.GFYU01007789.1~~GFYU01007789.1.p1  ORF type:complete len:361 (-),score=70.44 GFYU01007789.1:129-1211(-)